MDELSPDAARWSPRAKPTAARYERVMWTSLGLFHAASFATAAVVLFAFSFQAFAAGVVLMAGTGASMVFTRGIHEAHQLTTPVQRPVPTGSDDDWEIGEA